MASNFRKTVDEIHAVALSQVPVDPASIGKGRVPMSRREAELPSVLLVEDEALIAAMAADWLAEHGFKVYVATNAHDALLRLRAGIQIDALFTDIDLGGEVDGTMLALIARQLRPDLAVVYTSGRWGTAEQFPTVPGSHFLPKPYDPDEVCAVLRRLLAAREHPASRLSLA